MKSEFTIPVSFPASEQYPGFLTRDQVRVRHSFGSGAQSVACFDVTISNLFEKPKTDQARLTNEGACNRKVEQLRMACAI
jgi:hypothetical protein